MLQTCPGSPPNVRQLFTLNIVMSGGSSFISYYYWHVLFLLLAWRGLSILNQYILQGLNLCQKLRLTGQASVYY